MDACLDAEKQLRESLKSVESLKPNMAHLKSVLGEYVLQLQQSIIRNKTQYEQKLSQLKDSEARLKHEIVSNQQMRETLLEELSHELRNKEQSAVKVNEMKIQQDTLIKQRDDMSAQLQQVEVEIAAKIKEINQQRELMKNQSTLINDKLFQFEQLLGLRIESYPLTEETDNPQSFEAIKFVFNNIDPSDFNRQVFFVYDPEQVSIILCEPSLDPEITDHAMSIFTKTKEIGVLWKYMRTQLRNKLLQ